MLPVRIAVGGQAQLIYLAATLAQDLGFTTTKDSPSPFRIFPAARNRSKLCSAAAPTWSADSTITPSRWPPRASTARLRVDPALSRTGRLLPRPASRQSRILKGKIVGVSAAGSSTQIFLNYLLVTHGIKPEDVSVASIGMSATAVAAMTHGKVDAAIMTDPALEVVRKQMPSAVHPRRYSNRGWRAPGLRRGRLSLRGALFHATMDRRES